MVFCMSNSEISLHGAPNFRSLHGLRMADGRRIRNHAILRSDQLCELTADDWVTLRSIGLKAICDLRSDAERARLPNRTPADGGFLELAMEVVSDVRNERHARLLAEQPNARGAAALMQAIYRELPKSMASHLRRILQLFEDGTAPVLIHCAAGKDRTGFAVAVLLHALGADRETILADYLLSASNAPVTGDPRLEKLTHVLREMTSVNVGPDAIRALLDTREIYLQEALNEVNSEWGGLDGYLHALDFDTAARDRLRDHWLE